MPKCNNCLEEKLEMDMNSRDLCKDCWLKKYNKKTHITNIKAWKTRRENLFDKLSA